METFELKIAPSILSADFGKLNEEMSQLEPHADMFHVDVMDGHFVPNITIGPPVVAKLNTNIPMDVHLMIENPEKYVEAFAKAGGARLVFHIEATNDAKALVDQIHSYGVEAGVSIKPGTDVSAIKDILDDVEEVLVMTVEPGFGGQKFMADMVPKISELRELGYKGDIGVDGGVSDQNAKLLRDAGANLLIAGSYIFKSDDRVDAIRRMRV